MGIRVVWDDETRTCVRYDVRGTWTLADLTEARRDLEALITDVQTDLAVIVDVRESQFMPDGMFVHFGKRGYSISGQMHLMVFVGASGLMHGLVASYQRIYRKSSMEWLFADDLEGARQLVLARLEAQSALT